MQVIYTTLFNVILKCTTFLGAFGFLMMSLILVPCYYIKIPFSTNPRGVIDDLPDAITQIMNNKLILLALIGKKILKTCLIIWYI